MRQLRNELYIFTLFLFSWITRLNAFMASLRAIKELDKFKKYLKDNFKYHGILVTVYKINLHISNLTYMI